MRTKLLALVMACVMVLGSNVTAFAAETTDETIELTTNSAEAEIVDIPVVFEEADSSVNLATVGSSKTFSVGEPGYISSCGNNPTFKMWVTGGSSSTQVVFYVVTSGGSNYGPFGPVKADGSNYLTKTFAVIVGSGTWTFNASVTEGSSSGLVCHVQQIS